MLFRIRAFALALVAFAPAVIRAQTPAVSAPAAALTPPLAAVRPHRFDEFGTVRIDNYYWLKERSNPEVIKYLEDENAYTKAVMAHTQALQDRLYEEMKGRVLQNDQSVPFREGNYFYYTRLVEGKNYPIYARKRGSVNAPEEIMIDANALAEGKATFLIRAWEVSSGEDLLAFAADTTGGIGREREQVLSRADLPRSDQERRLPLGQRVGVDHDLFRGVHGTALAGVDGIVLAFHEPRIVEVIALAERHGLVVLQHAPLQLVVESSLQRLRGGHDGLGVRILVFEVFDDVRIIPVLEPVVLVDAHGAKLVEAVRPHRRHGWRERRRGRRRRRGLLGDNRCGDEGRKGERKRADTSGHQSLGTVME